MMKNHYKTHKLNEILVETMLKRNQIREEDGLQRWTKKMEKRQEVFDMVIVASRARF